MLNPQDKEKNSNKNSVPLQKRQIYKKIIISLQAILQKHPQHRHQHDQQVISRFAQLSPFFAQLSQQISVEFSHNIIKKSRVYTIHGKKRIQQKGDNITMLCMPISGDIMVKEYQSAEQKQQAPTIKQLYSKLIERFHKADIRKKKPATERKVNQAQNQLKTIAVPNFSQIQGLRKFQYERGLLLGDLDKQQYLSDLYVKSQGYFLGLNLNQFYNCLFDENQRRIMTQMQIFRNLRCFDILDSIQLKIFVEKIKLLQYKKDDIVFKEGDRSQKLYVLIEGQAKNIKNAQLFKQDPNNLYRATPQSQGGKRIRKKQQELSYANFEGVFNYTPQYRRVQLGILSPITVFGQEQIANGLQRETQVQITSPQAKLYCFSLKQLQECGNGYKVDIDKFIQNLYSTITENRILARRLILCNILELQNKRNMNYFYVQPENKQHKKSRSVASRIYSTRHSSQIIRPASPVKPRYDNFNFNQFLDSTQTSNVPLSTVERSILRLTHNSTNIFDQVQAQSKLFTRRKSYKHKINIATPLFDYKYYKQQSQKILKMQNKRRNRIIVAEPKNQRKL